MVLKFYTSVAKGLNLKLRMVWGLIPTFVEVTGKKLVETTFLPPPPPLYPDRVKEQLSQAALTSSKSTMEIPEQRVQCVYS